VETYLNTLALPAKGTQCRQDTPFEAAAVAATAHAQSRVATENRKDIVGRVPRP
jgi:hypothetical protein